ncbi:hypothetical protein, partial [[Clostridium] innocuum]|uniref:hypothetical protein n=1 Tax=Clostridium innocuum TaxID=1522 RepID=UPI0005D233E0
KDSQKFLKTYAYKLSLTSPSFLSKISMKSKAILSSMLQPQNPLLSNEKVVHINRFPKVERKSNQLPTNS